MKKEKWFGFALSACLLLGFLAASSRSADAMIVWTDHATEKIRPNTPSRPDHSSAPLKAAKNEFEAFQVIVTADQGDLSGVDVSVGDLIDGHGNTLSGSAIMIYKEEFMKVGTPSTIQGAAGEWPDALIPKKDEYVGEARNAFPFSVPAGRNQPVWIEIYVPPTAAAGDYTGSVTVTAAGQNTVVIPIQLTVWNFILPSVSSLKSAYAIDYHLLPAGHGLPGADPPSADALSLLQRYAQANLLHRITDSYLPSAEQMGGSANGVVNWEAFDAAFGPLLDGTAALPGGKLPGNKMTTYQMSDWGHKTDIPYLKAYAAHFKSKGWFDRLFQYTCDEPPRGCGWGEIQAWTEALHQADPELRALVTTSAQRATADGVASGVDLFSPLIQHIDDKPVGSQGDLSMVGNQRSRYGAELWWYQACDSHGCRIVGGGAEDPDHYHTDWPAYMIDLPAMFNRVQQWESFKYDIQGELYYDMVYAFGQRDPWSSVYDFGGNGDGTLYYPGKPSKIGGSTHIPIESIRLKLIREGMEDYEYLNLLKTLGEQTYADAQVAQVVTNTYTFTKEPSLLYDAREKMAGRILAHDPQGGSNSRAASPPPVAPSASGSGGGGCAVIGTNRPTDFKEAAPYLLIFFSPFWGLLLRRGSRMIPRRRPH